MVDNPVVDNPVVDNPVVDNPVVDNPVVDNPVVDNPVVVATAAPIVQAVAARLAILREQAQAPGNLLRPQTIITPRACQVTG